ncbi:hypothetical protein [Mucilaginibacter gotjawali]|uniref:hypothetical protein n=1 Tax=Mucilaginibacter gotjawali TaxID=1550579 RepID=UPI0012FD19B8|nr:hypothetical protein [Mucilaginibacter gotjawali]
MSILVSLLTAAAQLPQGLVLFCLDTKKDQKNQDRKKLQRCGPDSLARFSVRPLPAFHFSLILETDLKRRFFSSPSADKLREKAGKTAGL